MEERAKEKRNASPDNMKRPMFVSVIFKREQKKLFCLKSFEETRPGDFAKPRKDKNI